MTYELLLRFDTDDPEFVRGFEAGRIWEALQTSDVRTFAIHARNLEMVARIAESLGLLPVRTDESASGWLEVTFGESPS